MKKLLIILIGMLLLGAAVFADGFSGETYIEGGYDLDDAAITYEVDAGAIYNIGWFTIGLDVFTDTFTDYNIGLPLTAVFGPATLKVEPGVDNLFDAAIFVTDADFTFAQGILNATIGAGYGTDGVLDVTGKITVTPADWIKVHLEYLDGTALQDGSALGDLELGCTLTY